MILKTEKKIRDLFSHDLKYSPTASYVLSIFGDVINLVEKITEYDKKVNIKELKSEYETKEMEAREMLGGKSEWGGPSLYGTPEQKLEQLKGYGGARIDEIRKELLQEIKDKNKWGRLIIFPTLPRTPNTYNFLFPRREN